MLCGLLFGLNASRFRFPRDAAYVVAGMVMSPDLLGPYIGINIDKWSEPITTAALGVIAYLIGGSITVAQARRIGRTIFSIALGESIGAAFFVFTSFMLIVPDSAGIQTVQIALAFAAMSATTAPAGTIAVLHQYRASGPVTTTLLGVVALDDAIGIILFSVMLVIAAGESLTSSLGVAFLDIGGSLVLGAIIGRILTEFGRRIHQAGLRLPAVLGAILFVVGLTESWHLSPLLGSWPSDFQPDISLGPPATGYLSQSNISKNWFLLFFLPSRVPISKSMYF